MEQQPNGRIRLVAIAATVLALLAVSVPFVWQEHIVVAEPAAVATPAIAPVASHDAVPASRSSDDPGACMANAKQANLDFTVKQLDGPDVLLSSFKGKVILLNFWATWCGPCKAEIPGFVELQEKYKNDLVILGYSVDDPPDTARTFARQFKMNYPVLLGEAREDVQDAFGPIWGIPASFVISRDGRVCRKHPGIAPKAVFEKEIVALL